MSATAFKNAVRRREHYERHQPKSREHLGLLEKHSDYSARAKNYHSKEKRIQELRKKAANRNPDEFYFKMVNTQTKKGVHKAQSERPILTADMLKVMKTQDRTYVQTMKNTEDKKIERLRASLQRVGDAPRLNKHSVFDADDDEENEEEDDTGAGSSRRKLSRKRQRDEKSNDTYDDEDNDEDENDEDVDSGAQKESGRRRANVSKSKSEDEDDEEEEEDTEDGNDDDDEDATQKALMELKRTDPEAYKLQRRSRKKLEKLKVKAYAELAAREDRAKKLARLGAQMDLERALLRKGRRVKVSSASGETPAVYRWKQERKR